MTPIQSVIILGGGTAGWMTAAAVATFLRKTVRVTLVESADIGSVGVGEATVPPIRQFNAMLDIAEGDFVKATRATFKLGIRFNDWRRVGHSYFHPFGAYGLGNDLGTFHQQWLMLRAAGLIPADEGLDPYSYCATAALRGKVTTHANDLNSPYSRLFSAYHFDASLYADFMRDYATQRGVIRVEGEVVDITRDGDSGFVRGLTLKDGRQLEADLFIDCSGFRALLSQHVPWHDWSHWLPMDRAWAMPCEVDGGRVPYTTSTATEGGWMWRIPLQHRMGNGHVFSTAHMAEDRAREQLEKALPGKALAEPRLIRFRTGRREAFWNRNVVAIGLSGGFIEPLESTSIHLIQSAIQKLLHHWPDKRFSPANTAVFNQRLAEEYEHIRDVIILHYHLTERDDSSLWMHVRTMTLPDSLRERIEVFRERGMIINRPDEMFGATSWLAILMGQGLDPQGYSPLMDALNKTVVSDQFADIRGRIASAIDPLPSQDEFLRYHGLI
jgi:tryptophan halogenase